MACNFSFELAEPMRVISKLKLEGWSRAEFGHVPTSGGWLRSQQSLENVEIQWIGLAESDSKRVMKKTGRRVKRT
jgi:hypothetical protein